jgi:hypothetical protein
MKVGDFVREKVDGTGTTEYPREAGIVVEIQHLPANDYAPVQFRIILLGETKPALHERNARFYEVINESR